MVVADRSTSDRSVETKTLDHSTASIRARSMLGWVTEGGVSKLSANVGQMPRYILAPGY